MIDGDRQTDKLIDEVSAQSDDDNVLTKVRGSNSGI
jgi:hypothetical protein